MQQENTQITNVLVTGGAGFIGSHLVASLLAEGKRVTIVDNFDPFYDPAQKHRNLQQHIADPLLSLVQADIRDYRGLQAALQDEYDVVVHLAARAGVRPSLAEPILYQEVNIGGTQNMLELAKDRGITQFVFASSSSVYGVNERVPWREDDAVLLPISPYAATKVSGELLGHVYSHVYGIRFIALRFFTVYGPRQRPDLAIHKFSRLMLDGQAIQVYGDGSTRRDYTYVDDTVAGIRGAMRYSLTPYEVINLGNNRTVSMHELISALEDALQVKARLEFGPEQPGDVPQTWADIDKASRLLHYHPSTSLQEGLAHFARWIKESRL